MKEYTRVAFYISHRQINDELKLCILDHRTDNSWTFETLWLNGKLIDWNLGGIKPTRSNLYRVDARIIAHLRKLLSKANIYPKVLWEHLLQ